MTDSGGTSSTAGCVNDKDDRGLTALHRASGLGDASAVRGLLDGGADAAILDSRMGASPLHHAAQSGSVEVARLLLAAGAFLNLQAPRNGVTPLMAAVWYCMPDLVAFLLQQPEIDVEQRALFGATAAELIGFGGSADDEGAQRQNDQLRRLFTDYAGRRHAHLAGQPLFLALTDPGASRADKVSRVRELLDAGHGEVDAVSPVLSSGSDGHTALPRPLQRLHTAARRGVARALCRRRGTGQCRRTQRPRRSRREDSDRPRPSARLPGDSRPSAPDPVGELTARRRSVAYDRLCKGHGEPRCERDCGPSRPVRWRRSWQWPRSPARAQRGSPRCRVLGSTW